MNTGANDVGHGVTGARFQSARTTLPSRAGEKYPTATLFAMGTFRERYLAETRAAVQAFNDADTAVVDTTGRIVEATDTVDDVHPNDPGHRKIADRLAPIISARIGG